MSLRQIQLKDLLVEYLNYHFKIKKMRKTIILLFVGLLVLSCQDQLDINRDPDTLNPSSLSLNGEMPAATTGVATSMGSYYAIIGGLWSQFYTQSAVANQYKTIDNYSIGAGDYNGAWSSMYDALLDARNVKNLAKAQENWNYYLMATVVEAYGFQVLTDMYGRVPYTQAVNSSFQNPVYDDETVIYDGLEVSLLDALSKDLDTSSKDVIPGADDLVFAGDMNKWKEFANTLLLKIYLRQVNVRPDVARAGISKLYNDGVQFLKGNAAITQYVDETNKSNPLFEANNRNLNVSTNLRASTTLVSFLEENSDPRLQAFYTSNVSQNQGDFTNSNGANVGVVVLKATDPVYFISEAESYFLQAEVALRYGFGNASDLYKQGVLAAFGQYGLDGSSFVDNNGAYELDATSLDNSLKSVLTQKWVSFFPGRGGEAFVEQLRTGYPKISSVPQSSQNYIPGELAYSLNGTTGGLFPKRIVYPQSEIQSNSNFPGLIKITEKRWYEN